MRGLSKVSAAPEAVSIALSETYRSGSRSYGGSKPTYRKGWQNSAMGGTKGTWWPSTTSMVVRSQADRLKQQIAERRERFQQARGVLDQERRVLQSHQAEVQQAREDMPPEPPPLDSATLTERSNTLRAARGQFDEYERERQNHENLLRQLNALTSSRELAAQAAKSPNLLLLILLGLIGAALIVVAVLLGDSALPLGIASGLALLTTVAILYLSAKASLAAIPAPMTTELERQTSDAEAAAEKRLQSLMQLTATLGHTDQPNTAVLELVEVDLESARTALNTWTGVKARVEETSRREKSQELLVEAAIKEYEAAKGIRTGSSTRVAAMAARAQLRRIIDGRHDDKLSGPH